MVCWRNGWHLANLMIHAMIASQNGRPIMNEREGPSRNCRVDAEETNKD